MPTYLYKCDQCGHKQDHKHAMSEEPDLECDECGHDEMTRQITASNFKVEGGTPKFH